jgi:hypothetical protein
VTNETFEPPERGVIVWPVGTGDSTTVVLDDEHWIQIDIHHLVDPAGSLPGYVKEAGGARRSDGRAPDEPVRDRAER